MCFSISFYFHKFVMNILYRKKNFKLECLALKKKDHLRLIFVIWFWFQFCLGEAIEIKKTKLMKKKVLKETISNWLYFIEVKYKNKNEIMIRYDNHAPMQDDFVFIMWILFVSFNYSSFLSFNTKKQSNINNRTVKINFWVFFMTFKHRK